MHSSKLTLSRSVGRQSHTRVIEHLRRFGRNGATAGEIAKVSYLSERQIRRHLAFAAEGGTVIELDVNRHRRDPQLSLVRRPTRLYCMLEFYTPADAERDQNGKGAP